MLRTGGWRASGAPMVLLLLLAGISLAVPQGTRGQQPPRYEVWIIDQQDAARGGARLYIYDGQALEAGQTPAPQVVTLDEAARGVGDGPGVRPHLLAFNSTHSHAVIAYVASGHVQIMRTRDRRIVASIDVGEQAHAAYVSPDDALIMAANQNGKRLARIRADFRAERFTYNRNEDLNLGAMQSAARPDNAPICPIVFVGNKAYVTLRGGGLYVVNVTATPMSVVRAYGNDEVKPAGCGGMMVRNKVYMNSGTGDSSDVYVFNPANDTMTRYIPVSPWGRDGHGMVATGGGRYLWMGNRADHNIAIIDTQQDEVVGTIEGVGKAPDLMDVSPSGRRVYVALRGPNPLTGGHPATGETPGLAILEVADGGRQGRRAGFIPIGDQSPRSPVDPHAVAVRVVR